LQLRQQLSDKEEEAKNLLYEGEKLSKDQLKLSNTIKSLRAKESKNDKTIGELQTRVNQLEAEGKALKEKIEWFETSDKRLRETIDSLNHTNDTQVKQLVKLEGDIVLLKDEKSNIQTALDKAWSELAETRKQMAEATTAATSEALEKEVKANEELHKKLELIQKQADSTEATLKREIVELQATLARVTDEAGWKEDTLRKEVNVS